MNQRRSFLKTSAVIASAMSVPALARAAVTAPNERVLRLYNTHTGESVKSVFWAEGQFVPDALADINKLLRDHRNDSIANMDPQLLLLLERVSKNVGPNDMLHVISGYRSPASNALLAAASDGVAKHSMHLEGKAIDIRMPGRSLATLHKAAMNANGGGVGYYPASQFVHMDTGRPRHW
ncbi:DUF882 domain-containing protein [Massilia sp. TSP1-1-2]|uniref:DUF882 domain-containing protein n=1 Tax=unclassified Massilia TaxID=2609279 RepID=UPI003CF12ABA